MARLLFGSEGSVTRLSENDVKSDTQGVLAQIACVFNFIGWQVSVLSATFGPWTDDRG